MAAKKKPSIKKKPPIFVEEEAAPKSVAPVVEEVEDQVTPIKPVTSVTSESGLDENASGVVQDEPQPTVEVVKNSMEPQEVQQDVRRPETQEGGIWDENSSGMGQPKKSSKAPFYIALIVVIGLLGAGGAYLYLQNQQAKVDQVEEEQLVQTEEPTPTPTIAFDRSEWSLEVLNGTTTAGLAARVASELKELGYEVDTTGNSSKKVTATELYVSADMKDTQEAFLEDLKGKFGITEITGTLEDSDASARIVVGPQEEEEVEEDTSEEPTE